MTHFIKANLTFLIKDHWKSFLIFWAIYIGSVGVLYALSNLTTNVDTMITPNIPPAIYAIVVGLLLIKETFPFAIKYGSPRQAYTISVMMFFVVLSIVLTVISQGFMALFDKVTEMTGNTNFQMPFLIEGEIVSSFWDGVFLEFSSYLLVLSLTSMAAALYYRMGKYSFLIFAAVIASLFIRGVIEAIGRFIGSIDEVTKYIDLHEWSFLLVSLAAFIILFAVMSRAKVR